MSITVFCSSCSARIKASDNAAGKHVKCPKCGMTLLVPAATGSTPDRVQDVSPAPRPAAVSPATPPPGPRLAHAPVSRRHLSLVLVAGASAGAAAVAIAVVLLIVWLYRTSASETKPGKPDVAAVQPPSHPSEPLPTKPAVDPSPKPPSAPPVMQSPSTPPAVQPPPMPAIVQPAQGDNKRSAKEDAAKPANPTPDPGGAPNPAGDKVTVRDLTVRGLKLGAAGRAKAIYAKVFQVIDDNSMLVLVEDADDPVDNELLWTLTMVKCPTKGIVDGKFFTGWQSITGASVLKVIDTTRYTTADGGTKTVFVLEPDKAMEAKMDAQAVADAKEKAEQLAKRKDAYDGAMADVDALMDKMHAPDQTRQFIHRYITVHQGHLSSTYNLSSLGEKLMKSDEVRKCVEALKANKEAAQPNPFGAAGQQNIFGR